MSEPGRRSNRKPTVNSETRPPSRSRSSSTRDDLIVIQQRPSQGSAALLPPILMLIVCLGFLLVRSSTREWQGLGTVLAQTWTKLTSRPKPLIVAQAPAPATTKLNPEALPSPKHKPQDADRDQVSQSEQEPLLEKTEGANPALAKMETEDKTAWDDIEREAKQKQAKLEELVRLKTEQSDILAKSKDERQRAADLEESKQRFAGRMDPKGFEQMVRAQRAMMERQMAHFAEIQKQQMRGFADMQRRFGFPENGPPGALPPGFRFEPPKNRNRFGGPGLQARNRKAAGFQPNGLGPGTPPMLVPPPLDLENMPGFKEMMKEMQGRFEKD